MNALSNEGSPATPRLFWGLLFFTLAFRCWMAMVTPITGDEAYFIEWGRRPDWGFYDHPPMIGWWLALLLQVSDAPGWVRLPIVVQPAVLALSTWVFLRPHGAERAFLAATLILLAPISVWGVFITTDTPLIYFSFFSALAFIRAARDDDWRFNLLAGLLLGGAFLSKYFAVLLGAAFAIHALYRPTRRKLFGLLLVVAGALPGPFLNAWWNMGHCWANIMFNAFNRNEGAALSLHAPLLYGATILYVLTPMAVWALARSGVRSLLGRADGAALLAVAFVPLGVFAVLSLVKVIGLHWVLSFVPFVLMAAALVADGRAASRLRRFFLGFAILHMAAFGAIAALSLENWQRWWKYDGIVMIVAADELLARLKPYERDFAFAADGYSPAVTLGYNAGRPFFVFGPGSSHARHDDILTDFRRLDGRNILIVRKNPPQLERDYAPYFRSVAMEIIDVRGARFWIVLGRGFLFEAYHGQVLASVRERYYAVPRWLPLSGCYFCDRYFPGQRCARPE